MIMHLFRCFPIKNNKIFMFSYYGAQYGCNPKYITEYMEENNRNDKFDVVWAFNKPLEKEIPSYVRKVKTMSLRFFYDLCTAKVVITNFRTTDLFMKRKDQYYVQTWHSSLRLKQIEEDAEDHLPANYIEMAKADSLKCDLLLSGCTYSTDIFNRSFWYKGEIFEHGTPRNDLLLEGNLEKTATIRKKLQLNNDKKIILYAPTFRKDNDLTVYNIDYEKLVEKLANRFSGDWVVLVKLHPHLLKHADQLITNKHVMNVTDYDDIQELLYVSDILISDYSSLVFDYMITKRPCFLYVPDIDIYTKRERELYFNLAELPFIQARSNKELMQQIAHFNKGNYQEDIATFLSSIGSFERGKASEYLLTRLETICFPNEARRVAGASFE